jgi:hypothetical protein
MNLDAQIQSLVDNAPDAESRVSALAVSAIIKRVAETFPGTEYYIAQSPEGDWLVTTLQHRQNPQEQIQVIYAYANEELVPKTADTIGFKLPIIHLLFEVMAVSQIDRVLFVERSELEETPRSVGREDLERLVAETIQQLPSPSLPPDVC